MDIPYSDVEQPTRRSGWRAFFGAQRFWLHILLFALTLFTTTLAGVEWRGRNPFELLNLGYGLEYSLCLLAFLSAHEFGHFIAARRHGVDATLPFYIPMPGLLLGLSPNFGTFGAVIRTRTRMQSRKVIFDVGVAGPLAGFVVCLILLALGFMTLPGIEYLRSIHPGYPTAEPPGTLELTFGRTLLYQAFEAAFAPKGAFIPPMTEMYHYPLLCVGWFGLFVTALNLLPVGQLDGGHLMYAMFSKKTHGLIGRATAIVLLLLAIPDTLVSIAETGAFHLPAWLNSFVVPGASSWLVWAILVSVVIRFRHPEPADNSPLGMRRRMIGYLTMAIFVISFTPSPLVVMGS